MKWKLHPVTDHDGLAYCFPALLEPLTGCSYDKAVGYINAIRKVSPNAPVSGVDDREINLVLRNMGLKFFASYCKHRPTVKNFARRAKKNTLYLLSLTQHVVLLYNGKIIDNRTCHGPERVEDNRCYNWRVEYVYEFKGLEVCFKKKNTVYFRDSTTPTFEIDWDRA